MDLFNTERVVNILPYDGQADYYGRILPPHRAQEYLYKLLADVEWRNDEAVIFGKRIVTRREVAWYGDDSYSYTYSNTTKYALAWTPELLELKTLIESLSGAAYNSCLLNLYHNGDEGMAWHSDAEKELEVYGAIASLSLGAARKFLFKHKRTDVTVDVLLETGSLLVMKGTTQTHWLHSLPKTKKVSRPRINLTFRKMVATSA